MQLRLNLLMCILSFNTRGLNCCFYTFGSTFLVPAVSCRALFLVHRLNASVHLLQVPWWLPTTCARPKSASRPTATAATAATTRTSVTGSPSFSQRTPASVSFSSSQLLFDSLIYFLALFFNHLSVFCTATVYFHPLFSAGLFPPFCAHSPSFFIFSHFSFSPSLFQAKNIPFLGSHCYPTTLIEEPAVLQQRECVCP